jgi:hypothetical protein
MIIFKVSRSPNKNAAKQKTHSTEWVGLAKRYLKSDQTNATMEWDTKIERN